MFYWIVSPSVIVWLTGVFEIVFEHWLNMSDCWSINRSNHCWFWPFGLFDLWFNVLRFFNLIKWFSWEEGVCFALLTWELTSCYFIHLKPALTVFGSLKKHWHTTCVAGGKKNPFSTHPVDTEQHEHSFEVVFLATLWRFVFL